MNEKLTALEQTMNSVILGKPEAVKTAIVTLIAKGHLLIEDVPGVGKTVLALTLARALDCSFQKIQFTSDLLPSDIIGVNIYDSAAGRFDFKPGPLFANIVLADEINRTNPKTQSALLEAMSERRVSVERKTYVLPEPFMVVATQNPMEYHGTFPLPESQLDRFMTHIRLGYPDLQSEKQAVLNQAGFDLVQNISPVIESSEILKMQAQAATVSVGHDVLDYLLAIVRQTRENENVRLGASTRAAQFLLNAAKAHAYYFSRDFLTPDDVKEMSLYVLGHRIILKKRTSIADSDRAVRSIIERVPVPV